MLLRGGRRIPGESKRPEMPGMGIGKERVSSGSVSQWEPRHRGMATGVSQGEPAVTPWERREAMG